MAQPDRPQMTKWHMYNAFWIPKLQAHTLNM